MKRRQFGGTAAWGAILLAGLILGGCGNQQPKTVEVPMAGVPAAEEYEENETDDFVEDEDAYYEEDTEAYEEVYEETESEPENLISYEQVMQSYDELLDVYNQVNELYQSDDVPRSEDVEELLSTVGAEMDEIHALSEEDLPTDEDRLAVMKRVGELNEGLSSLIDPLLEAAEEEAENYRYLAEYVQQNYEYMEQYFNTVWDYFSRNGGSDAQIEDLIRARDEIGEIDDLSTTTTEELNEMNERIDAVISLLEQLAAST